MPVIQVHDEQHTLQRGQTRLGAGPDADVRVGVEASLGVQALLELGADDRAVIRRARDAAAVRVNGVALGVEPVPLMHGDKVEIGGVELLFSDDRNAGATQYVPASEVAAMAARRGGSAMATGPTGGRLVSLVDGKEYAIADAGLAMGRDAGNDVVIAQSAVSRRHARVAPGDAGYVLTDQSTNGVFVNGERVQGTRLLARADVIRVGSEEFRFYADVASARPPAAPAPAPPPAAPAAPAVSEEPPTLPPPEEPRPVLAELEIVKEGPDKGRRIAILEPLAHVGRGAHNEVSLGDDSVSDTHAKLQLRDDGWYVVDAGSTNGTFVGGVRISGERRLEGTPDLRFGGMRVRFHPAALPALAAEGTRRVSLGAFEREYAPMPKRAIPRWVWIAAVAVLALIVFLILQTL